LALVQRIENSLSKPIMVLQCRSVSFKPLAGSSDYTRSKSALRMILRNAAE
jgi:hypothetical protein